MDIYMNRDNGALVGFYNTSYITPTTNWTDYAENTSSVDDDDDDHGGEDDDDLLIVESQQGN